MKNNVKRKFYKAKNLKARFNKNETPPIIIYPEKCHLYKISSESEDNIVVKFYDGSKLIFEVNKKDLKAAVDFEMAAHFVSRGVEWKIPLYEHALEIDYKVEHELIVEGDVSGIILWVDGKALG